VFWADHSGFVSLSRFVEKVVKCETAEIMDKLKYSRSVTLAGIEIPVYEGIFSPNIVRALENETYEGKESRELPKIIQEGERILEIGAGIGFISALAARDPRISAIRVYEANPLLIRVIKEIHALNGIENVEIRNGVLLNQTRGNTSKFYVRRDFWSSSLDEKPFGYKEVIDVPNFSFSAEIEDFNPTMIICDIEGGERDLFMNANLSGVKKIYVEVHQRVIGRKGMKRLFDAMSARDFHYDQWHSHGSVVLFSHVDR
jgi:FkbM family methyltransferase